ncbi:hypothetical protein [Paenibacillus sp. MBLB4367]|uniref:hypothetical protein n=1 Tax=Paenibacillus sp. MBLB4367 TaxID=3384767 RepID=UPI003907F643
MEREANQLCPWCQTEIVWDPEIGAEDECPHCLNQLGGYRSLTFSVKSKGDNPAAKASSGAAGHETLDSELDDWEEEEDFEADELDEAGPAAHTSRSGRSPIFAGADDGFDDVYGEKVERYIDTQEEAPECISCRELMLLAGHRELGSDFVPHTPDMMKGPFLIGPVRMDVYVCPNCFRTETMLAEEDRIKMIKAIKEG